jgi:hypothetical protein
MFSANENLLLRQHKRRIVDRIERSMPEHALDVGTTVMVMQVTCTAPGCVPLETAIIVVFPKAGDTELVPGLPESRDGGSYKTKILKPMADVTEDDILEALPPAFEGGKRTMEKLCIYARDVMIGQITQLFGEDDEATVEDRMALATYLQSCLQQYIAAGCRPPGVGEPFPSTAGGSSQETTTSIDPQHEQEIDLDRAGTSTSTNDPKRRSTIPSKGNVVLRRVMDESESSSSALASASAPTAFSAASSATTIITTTTTSARGQQPPRHQRAITQALNSQRSNAISRLFNREHSPGIRQAGCPCCDPDNPSTIAESMMML